MFFRSFFLFILLKRIAIFWFVKWLKMNFKNCSRRIAVRQSESAHQPDQFRGQSNWLFYGGHFSGISRHTKIQNSALRRCFERFSGDFSAEHCRAKEPNLLHITTAAVERIFLSSPRTGPGPFRDGHCGEPELPIWLLVNQQIRHDHTSSPGKLNDSSAVNRLNLKRKSQGNELFFSWCILWLIVWLIAWFIEHSIERSIDWLIDWLIDRSSDWLSDW